MVEKQISFSDWIDEEKSNPSEYRRRQVIEIILTAIGSTAELYGVLVLKGGTLMNLVYQSPRSTIDVDFSTNEKPEGFAEFLKTKLDATMRTTAVKLGYPDLICKVQSWEMRPPLHRKPVSWPTLRVKIGYAESGTRQEDRLNSGIATRPWTH